MSHHGIVLIYTLDLMNNSAVPRSHLCILCCYHVVCRIYAEAFNTVLTLRTLVCDEGIASVCAHVFLKC